MKSNKFVFALLMAVCSAGMAFGQDVGHKCVANCGGAPPVNTYNPPPVDPAAIEAQRRAAQGHDLNELGVRAYNNGDFASAADYFHQALAYMPNDATVANNLANANEQIRKKQEADARRAQEARDRQEKFERDKADALNSLKGVSSGNLELKDPTASKPGKNSGLGLKGVGDTDNKESKASNLPRIGAGASIVGDVRIIRGSGEPFLIKSGEALRSGDKVITGSGSSAQFLLLDETVFTLGPNSALVMDEFVYDPAANSTPRKIMVTITKGVFRWVTGKVAKRDPDSLKVRLATGTIGIRGTDFQIKLLPSGDGSISLYEGRLEITLDRSKRIFPMEAGQIVFFSASGSYGMPRRMKPSELTPR